MKRTEWEFTFTNDEVRHAIEAKIMHHSERLRYWTAKEDEAKKALREQGIDFRESVMAKSGVSTMYVDQPTFDQTKLKALQEAQERVKHHTFELKTYESWAGVLATQTISDNMTLDYEDVLFFGLDSTP